MKASLLTVQVARLMLGVAAAA